MTQKQGEIKPNVNVTESAEASEEKKRQEILNTINGLTKNFGLNPHGDTSSKLSE